MSSIDIVIPCYRYGRYLQECVRSVLTQDVEALRILIIDDESPDETSEVGTALAAEDSRVTYLRHAVNRGHIPTFNEGIDWCCADYMLLLSADDYLLPGALKRAMALMDAHPDVGLCFGNALCLQEDGSTQRMKVGAETGGEESVVLPGVDFVDLCIRAGANNVVGTPTAVVKTSLLKCLGGYRADLPHSGDLEMWLRLAAHAPVGFVSADQAIYRRHAANMSNGYLQDCCLADLQQRKAAFDAFHGVCGTSLPETRHLYLRLLALLAREAVSHASSAFNSDRMALSRRLRDFAAGLHPPVRRTSVWYALSLKQLLGLRLSSAMRQAIKRGRAAMARIRGKDAHQFP